jgi:hypothetical protein
MGSDETERTLEVITGICLIEGVKKAILALKIAEVTAG